MAEIGWEELWERARQLLELGERLTRESAVRRSAGSPSPHDEDRVQAYRWRGGALDPIPHPDLYPREGLLEVEASLDRLILNLAAFVAGRPALDVLLYGERGTGKSTAVRVALGLLGSEGLRLVEVAREDLLELPRLFALLRDRPGRYVLFCDDLSFGEGDPSYRALKSVLDGGVEARPAHVLVVATSNRRHLIPERKSENRDVTYGPDGELHLSETSEEKLSLSDRFGLLLPFFGFDQAAYLRIVDYHAARVGLASRLPEPELHARALRFALERASRSGRTARQACVAILQELAS